MTLYTIDDEACAELEAKGSRFLAFLVPMAKFRDRLGALRVEHRKATHHVTASRAMGAHDRIEEHANDDGEPARTSGMPALKVLIGASLVECGVIVVRYFGGTKLGTGGLARAYSGATARALDAARLVEWHRIARRTLLCPFERSGALETEIAAQGVAVLDRVYSETGVAITVEGHESDVAALAQGWSAPG